MNMQQTTWQMHFLGFILTCIFNSSPLEARSLYDYTLTADFAYRDRLPETLNPRPKGRGKWQWGPRARAYPAVLTPKNVDAVQWKRDRVVAVAKKYIGLPYKHRHIPSQGGLDCSNFTAWVYNYGFGIHFSSAVQKQSQTAGRKLLPDERLEPGDLLFIWNKARTKITHVVIYVNEHTIIDSTIDLAANGVALRPLKGWYVERFAFARRIFS